MNKSQLTALAALAALFSGCTSTPQFQSGPDAEVTHDGLTRVDKTVMDTVWARTDIDVSDYNKILLQGVGVEYRPVKGAYSGSAGSTSIRRSSQSEFQLDDKTKAIIEEEIRGAFVEELARSNRYEIVSEPGPDVLTLRVGLLDVISRVPPDTIGRSTIDLDKVGEATLVMELRDSVSNAILARAIDRRAADRGPGDMVESNRVNNRAEVRRLGRRWASIVRSGLETLMSKE
jgi:hypothetical protein